MIQRDEFSVGRNNTSNGRVTVESGGTLTTNGTTFIGRTGVGELNVNAGTVNFNAGWTRVGEAGSLAVGTLNLSAGTINNGDWLVLGNEAGATGTGNISGGTINFNRNGDFGRFVTARLGTATVNQTGGDINVGNWFAVGIDGGGNGTYNFSGGTINLAGPIGGDVNNNNITIGNNGTGVMNISHGNPAGTTITGTSANGVVNHINVGGDSFGNGTLNINLADAADRIISRELYAGWSSNGTASQGVINVTKGHLQTNGWVEIGRGNNGNGGTGTVNIDGPEAVWDRGTINPGVEGYRADMNIGQGEDTNLGNGNINILNGGTLNTNWWLNLARQRFSQGHVVVDGAGSTINMLVPDWGAEDRNSQLNVGQGGTGTLMISNGGVFNHMMVGNTGVSTGGGGEVYISRDGTATGTATVTGLGSALNTKAREFRVANDGTGTLNIIDNGVVNFTSTNENSTVANGNFGVAQHNSSNGTINMDNGHLNISAWSMFGAWEDSAVNSVATINMVNGSTIDLVNDTGDHGRLLWGRRGTATINQDGGSVHVGQWAVLGVEGGGRGNWNMSNGAVAQLDNELNIGRNGGIGNMSVSGGTSASSLTVNGSVFVGRDGNGSNGTLNVTDSSAVILGEFNIGHGGGAGSTGLVNVTNSTMRVNGWTTLGRDTGGAITTSTLNLTNSIFTHDTPNSGDMLIGWQAGSTAAVNMNSSTMIQSWWTRIGLDAGATGTMLVDNNSTFIGGLRVADGYAAERGAGHLRIGENGVGTLTVSNNSSFYFQGTEARIATDNGTGTLNITDSTMEFRSMNDDGTQAGGNFGLAENNGNATLNMNNGVLNISGWSLFTGWNQVTSKATINMTNSIINLGGSFAAWGEGHLFLGDSGQFAAGGGSTLNQEGGEIHASGWSAIGRERGGDAVYNLGVGGGGGVFTVGGVGGNELYVGRQSHGTINMGPGTVIQVANALNLAQETSPTTPATGTVNNNGGGIQVGGEFNVGRNGPTTNVGTYTQTAGTVVVNGEVFVGRDSTQGTINLTGGTAQFNNNLGIGMGAGGSIGTVNVSGPGTSMTVNGWTTMGRDTGGSPTLSTLNVTDEGLFQHLPSGGGDFLLGWQNGSTAVVNVTTGGDIIYNWWMRAGVDPGSNGTINLDGPGSSISRDTGRTYIGEQGIGRLNITNGATFSQTNSDQFNVGGNDGSSTGNGDGKITVTNPGSALSTNNFLRVGFGNTGGDPAVGVLEISDGGAVNVNGWLGIGHEGGDGTLTMTDGTLGVANELYVGIDNNGHSRQTTGTANISGGTVNAATMIVGRSGGAGVVNISGGAVTATNSVALGVNSSSTFAITNYATADAVIDGGPEQAFSFTDVYSTSNTQDDNNAGGPFGLGVQLVGLPGGDNDDFAFVGVGDFTVDVTGSYIFGNNTDDGSRLRLSINGGLFTDIITDDVLSGPHTVLSAAQALNAGDTITLEWMWFERGGGAEGETWYSRDGGPDVLWENSTEGLTLAGGVYSGTVYKSATTVNVGDGTLNLTGGVLATGHVEAGAGTATLEIAGGTLQALQTENDFIRGFTDSGGHSAIMINGTGGTIDTNGFDVRIQGTNVITTDDVLADGFGGTVLTKIGAGTLAIESTLTGGTLSIDVEAGTLSQQSDWTIDELYIADGAVHVIDSLGAPPPTPAFAFDNGGAAGAQIQGVPEPGTISMLLVTALGLLGRRNRRKES